MIEHLTLDDASECPKGRSECILTYSIAYDAYLCIHCGAHHEVLAVEKSHVDYQGKRQSA